MLRNTRALRRPISRHFNISASQHRHLHEDAPRGSDFLAFSLSATTLRSNGGFGMDMTRAPGYEVAADEEPPLVGNQKLVDFAARHARLSASQIAHASGYMWVGSVLYPSGYSTDSDLVFTWETIENEEVVVDQHSTTNQNEQDTILDKNQDNSVVDQNQDNTLEKENQVIQAKRRYSGGQARRIRKEREKIANRKAARRNTKVFRKPKDDLEGGES